LVGEDKLNMPENFEEFLKKKYWEKEEFREVVEKSAKGKGVSKPTEKFHFI